MKRLVYTFITVVLMPGCNGRRSNDGRLAQIADIVSDNPKQALADLDSIDYGSLADVDRHFYDLLMIKARDKAYITHTSDSLIIDVIDYYAGSGLYPEALYYGGRVYSDMGDAPSALSYFHKSISEMETTPVDDKFKCCVISQTARLLTSQRMYDEAIPYIESAIEIEKDNGDTLLLVNDLQLLGDTYLRSDRYVEAEKAYNETYSYSNSVPATLMAKSDMNLAVIKNKTGRVDQAVELINGIRDRVSSRVRNLALGYASSIYLSVGMLDSAYVYADELAHNDNPHNKIIGYKNLLKPELRAYIPNDSLERYLSTYADLVEDRFDDNGYQMVIYQQGVHNYQIHEKARIKAEKSNRMFMIGLLTFAFACLMLCIIVLYLKNKNKANVIKLHQALSNLRRLEINISHNKSECEQMGDCFVDELHNSTSAELREQLRNKLLLLYDKNKDQIMVPSEILNSNAYKRLIEYIDKDLELKSESKLWKELEAVILEVSPNFKTNLQLLLGGKFNSYDLQTAILIKCGVPLKNMVFLLNRSKGTISSRRESMCLRAFGQKMGAKTIDGIIRLL